MENLVLGKFIWQQYFQFDLNQDYGFVNVVDCKYDNWVVFRGLCMILVDGKYILELRIDLGRVVRIFYINIVYRRENLGKNGMNNESCYISFMNV